MSNSKKRGVKKDSAKSPCDLYKQIFDLVNAYNIMCEAEGERLVLRSVTCERMEEQSIRHHSRVWMLDMATIALGRMGFREQRFKAFDAKLLEVVKEYDHKLSEDFKDDEEMWYARAQIERELKEYCGSFYKPEEERY